MTATQRRDPSLDFVRALMILVVCVAHGLAARGADDPANLLARILSPGMTMSLIAYLSAYLVAPRFASARTATEFLLPRLLRIFVPLWLCLAPIIVWHLATGLKPLTQHGLLHLFGLTAFIELVGARNTASIGNALWFVSAILVMYLVLPVLYALHLHRWRRLHLAALVLGGVAASVVFYGAQSFWNVFVGFCLGAFAAWSGAAAVASSRQLPWLVVASALVLGLRAAAVLKPWPLVSDLLLPLYPLTLLPLLLWLGARLPGWAAGVVSYFAALSFEFYVLHPYFIHHGYQSLFGSWTASAAQVALSLLLALVLAALLHPLAERVRRGAEAYLAWR